jgi:hypothetical protein
MSEHRHTTDAVFERVLELIDRGVPVSKVLEEFAPETHADVLGAVAAVQALIAEREGITPPPGLLSQIIENVSLAEAATPAHMPMRVRFMRTLLDMNPMVKVGVPVVAFAAIIFAVALNRTGTVPTDTRSLSYDAGPLQAESGAISAALPAPESAAMLQAPVAAKQAALLPPTIAPQAPAVSAGSAVGLVIEAALADAAADQAIATNDMANASLVSGNSTAVNNLGQFFDPNAF